jgi:hypothetical protein
VSVKARSAAFVRIEFSNNGDIQMKKNFPSSIQRTYKGNPLMMLAESGWDREWGEGLEH